MTKIARAPVRYISAEMLGAAGAVQTQARIPGHQPGIWHINVDGVAVQFVLGDADNEVSIDVGIGLFEREKVRIIQAIVKVGCRLGGPIMQGGDT